jgi:photosystem II stability/assembly factor-like uncharacterized protein
MPYDERLTTMVRRTPMNALPRSVFALAVLVLLSPFLAGSGGGCGDLTSGGVSNPPPVPPSFSVDDWQWSNPLPQGNQLFDVVDVGGTYDAVGASGTINNFSDGVVYSQPLLALYGVASGSGILMAVGSGGAILTSQDGTNWTAIKQFNPDLFGYRSVAYGNGAFVAVGLGTVYTSHDNGNHWSRQQLIDPTHSWFTRVVFENNLFVAVSDGDTIFTSPDGDAWSQGSIPNLARLVVTYGQGQYVGVSYFGSVFTSPDALTWTPLDMIGGVFVTINGVAYGNGMFVAVGNQFDGGIYYSPDAVSWTQYDNADDNYFNQVRFLNGQFIAVGAMGLIATSTDGATWTDISFRVTSLPILSVAYGNNLFLAAADDEFITLSHALYSSPDGVAWTELAPLPNNERAHRVKFMDGLFYVFCLDSIYSSPDGTSWTTVVSVQNSNFNDFLHANNVYIALGSNQSKILTSPDAVTWTERWSGPSYFAFTRVIYANNTFVMLTNYSNIFVSQDGIAWTEANNYTDDPFTDIAYGNGLFVVVGYYGTVYSSPDGVNWTNRVEGVNSSLSAVVFTPDGFVAVGTFNADFGLGPDYYGRLHTSLDGITWADVILPVNTDLYGLAYGGGGYLVAGSVGVILQSNTVTLHPGSP